MSNDVHPDVILPFALLHVDDPYVGSCSATERDWFAFHLDLMTTRLRPLDGHFSARWAEVGVVVNLAATGNTVTARRNMLELRGGFAPEYVVVGRVPSGGTGLVDDSAFRSVVGIRAGVSTSDNVYRVLLDSSWRQRFGVWDDYSIETTLDLALNTAPTIDSVLSMGLRGGVAYASRPWMTTSAWADSTSSWSVIVMNLYWTYHAT